MPTALVVADGSWVTNEVRAAFALGSWNVEEIGDPRTLTARLQDERVEVVIIDMQVGSQGGMALVRAVRQATEVVSRPRIVLLLDRSADEFLAKRAGADAWVLKPFDAPELRAALTPQTAPVGADEEE